MTVCRYSTAMQCHNFLCNGKSQSCAACITGTRFIQSEKLFKNAFQFMCRYSFAFILETYLNLCIRLFGTDFDCRARIAICHRIFQDFPHLRKSSFPHPHPTLWYFDGPAATDKIHPSFEPAYSRDLWFLFQGQCLEDYSE